ncbi:MAG: YeeE/YedE family protein [Solirubrobacterales bacterium]|nr:YeeE/YedE family protein [Solirubrobacterales bacterium]MBV9837937.1 YeeE/YedE family protein [Solirubrobacterales bacterium]
MRPRLGGLGLGLVFGVVLAWSGMTSPQVVREALLFERSYLFLFFASAVLVASVGLALLRRLRARALLVDAPIGWRPERPARRHIIGSLLFGIGWGICDSCPGPIATQVGQGIAWGLFTLAGVLLGVYAFLRREQPETEPATDRLPARVPGLSYGSAVGAQP